MCITKHLSILKFICHVFAQSTRLLWSSCNFRTSSGCLELRQSFASSANLDILLTMPLSRSLVDQEKQWTQNTALWYTWCHWCSAAEGFVAANLFGCVLLSSSGSIVLHYLGCHVPPPLQEAFHVVPCQMPSESPGRWVPLLCCYPSRRYQWHGQRSQAGSLGSCPCFWSDVESHLSAYCPQGVWLSFL